MGSKGSSVWSGSGLGYSPASRERRPELQPYGDPGLDSPAASSCADPFMLETRIDGLQNDDYLVALVPREDGKSGNFLPRPATKTQFFFLLLTWRQLLNSLEQRIKGSQSTGKTILEFGEVCVNFVTMEVRRSKRPITLTKQQFKLLKFLTLAPKQVFSREELLNQVWGYHHYPSTRTVDNHILILRQKLESSPARPAHFLTVHGIGYKFVP
jgi:DNA-binding winged helix-turn-helix (wHTH) protein